jgi:hypothetical protein
MTETTTETPTRVEGFITLTRDQRWGWGATAEESVKAARKAGSRNSAKGNRLVYALPAGAVDAYVDQMGAIRWTWAEDADKTAQGHNVETPRD